MNTQSIIGRAVRDPYHNIAGRVVQWDPLGAGLCDALVETADGAHVWLASHGLQPTDGKGGLPSRHAAQQAADAVAERQLVAIRAVADFARPWPGVEHGKAIVGRAIDGAIAAIRARADFDAQYPGDVTSDAYDCDEEDA